MPRTTILADAAAAVGRPVGSRERRDIVLTVVAVVLVGLAHAAWGHGQLAVDTVATAFLVPLVLVDLRERRLPDPLTLGGAAAVLALLAARGALTGDLGPLAPGCSAPWPWPASSSCSTWSAPAAWASAT